VATESIGVSRVVPARPSRVYAGWLDPAHRAAMTGGARRRRASAGAGGPQPTRGEPRGARPVRKPGVRAEAPLTLARGGSTGEPGASTGERGG